VNAEVPEQQVFAVEASVAELADVLDAARVVLAVSLERLLCLVMTRAVGTGISARIRRGGRFIHAELVLSWGVGRRLMDGWIGGDLVDGCGWLEGWKIGGWMMDDG
jgi:hypothetical protein